MFSQRLNALIPGHPKQQAPLYQMLNLYSHANSSTIFMWEKRWMKKEVAREIFVSLNLQI